MSDERDDKNDADGMFGHVIHSYTRAQALADGVLVDVTEAAREVGFKSPVAMTIAAWTETVEPDGLKETPPRFPKDGTNERGRLHDVVWMLHCAIPRGRGPLVNFELLVARDGEEEPRTVKLKAICGPGDTPEPVITILLPEED
jgi:hypothetical protein